MIEITRVTREVIGLVTYLLSPLDPPSKLKLLRAFEGVGV